MLTGKVAIVTGGSRGIGAAIARKLASMGANVALIYAGNQQAAEQVCSQCREYGVVAKAYRCDVSSFDQVKDTVAAVKSDFGTVHILVNNAGITKDGLIAMMKEESFDSVLDTNLKGAFHMIRHCAGIFLRNREGCIVNISSVSGLMGNAGQCNYSASKAGLIGLTKSVAKELAPSNIQVNALACGVIDTEMNSRLDAGERAALEEEIPAGRYGTAEEAARTVLLLADAPAYLTGQIIGLDGGMI